MSGHRTDETYRLPLLPWCRDCWKQIGEDDGDLPDECPDCGSESVMML